MPEDTKKTLPIESNSDTSLPGRFEESNSILEHTESPKTGNRWILISITLFAIISTVFFGYYFLNQDQIDAKISENIDIYPEKKDIPQNNIGEYGSDHDHAALMIVVDGEQVNFGLSQFQLTDKFIHFEDGNPYLIHKHATGVSLGMLFQSLKIKITPECIMFENIESKNTAQYCVSDNQISTVYLNGKIYPLDIYQYEVKHGDRILIYFGNSESISKSIKYLESLEIFDIPKKIPQYNSNEINV